MTGLFIVDKRLDFLALAALGIKTEPLRIKRPAFRLVLARARV